MQIGLRFRSLQCEEFLLKIQASAESTKAMLGNHTMTGHDNDKRVGRHRSSHRPSSLRPACQGCYLPVSSGLAAGYFPYHGEDSLLKVRQTCEVQICFWAGRTALQIVGDGRRQLRRLCRRIEGEADSNYFLPGSLHQQVAAQWLNEDSFSHSNVIEETRKKSEALCSGSMKIPSVIPTGSPGRS